MGHALPPKSHRLAMLRAGMAFWLALGLGCLLTVGLYLLMVHFGPRLGLRI